MQSYGFGREAKQNCEEGTDSQIRSALIEQLVQRYGWPQTRAHDYIARFLKMESSKQFVDEVNKKYSLEHKKVLEIGAGLGNSLISFRLKGIEAYGIEPAEDFYQIVRKRLQEFGLDPQAVIKSRGENLPYESCSFDFVLCAQVLEHVKEPVAIMEEINRVLKKGGICYITAPNYLSFKENHYRVPWVPMLPRSIAEKYLKLLGRNPDFFKKHITYIHFLKILSIARHLGWENALLKEMIEKSSAPLFFESKAKRLLTSFFCLFGRQIQKMSVVFYYYLRNILSSEISYSFIKKT